MLKEEGIKEQTKRPGIEAAGDNSGEKGPAS